MVAGVLLPGRLVAAIANELRVVAPFVLIECLWAGWCDAAGLGVWIGSVTAAAEAPAWQELKRLSQPMQGNRPSPSRAFQRVLRADICEAGVSVLTSAAAVRSSSARPLSPNRSSRSSVRGLNARTYLYGPRTEKPNGQMMQVGLLPLMAP